MNSISRFQEDDVTTKGIFTSATTLDEAYEGLGLKDFEIEFLRQRSTKRFSTPAASRAPASRSRLDF